MLDVTPKERFLNDFILTRSSILGELSKPMQKCIKMHRCTSVLRLLRMFDEFGSNCGAGAGDTSPVAMLSDLSLHLERVVFVDGDLVVIAGEDTDGLYFIERCAL